jgi:hypothetical protein
MFVSHEAMLPVGYPAARAGLAQLARGGWLRDASGQAYADGIAGLARAGPRAGLPGAPELVSVSLLEPVPRRSTMVLPLRWEAAGATGRLFPVLDANLVLAPADGDRTRLTFTGAYRQPLAAPGVRMDQVVLHRAASATVRSLLRQIAETIAAGPEVPGLAGAVSWVGRASPAGEGCGPGLAVS